MSIPVSSLRLHLGVVVGLLGALVLVAGCDGSASNQSSGSGADAARPAISAESSGRAGTTMPATLTQERKVERRGSLTLACKDVGASRGQVIAAVEGVDGYVADEQTTSSKSGTTARTSLTLVVPTMSFVQAMSQVAAAGAVVSRSQSAKDLTSQTVDVASRVRSATASLQRIRLLLSRATSLGDVVKLESVMGEREADLESLQAQRKSLAGRTDTATITVSLRPARAAVVGPTHRTGFVAGLSTGWHALTVTWTGLMTGVGTLLPLGLVLALPALLVWRYVRSRRRVPVTGSTT